MHKRLVLYLFILSLTFFTNVNGAESEGMPQLNPEFWVSQIFWLILTFGSLFIILSKFVLPKISNNLEMRKSQILENIETAEKQKIESENKIKEYDVAVCMYHDQALIPIKTLYSGNIINITLGLDFIRTSPDHGTALDIAGRKKADPNSLILAIKKAEDLIHKKYVK